MDLHVYRNSQDRRHDLRAQSREHGAVLAINAVTLTELIEKLTPDVQVATVGQRLLFALRAVEQGNARYALEAIDELKNAGADLLPGLAGYEAELKKAGLIDNSDRCWLAARRVAKGGIPWLQRFTRVVLHAIYDLTESEFALVGNVIESLPDGGTIVLFNATTNIKPTQFAEWTWQRFIKDESLGERTFPEFCRPSSPNSELLERLFVFDKQDEPLKPLSSLRILQAPGRYREIETIGSEIADLLSRGESASGIAVVVRNIESYGEMIEDVFSRYGIPHGFETGVPLLRVPFIKYWFALLDLITSERSRPTLARVMASAYFEPRLSPETDVERELAGFGYIDRHQLPASDLAKRKHSPLTPELLRLETWFDRLESDQNTVAGFLAEFKAPPFLMPRDLEAWLALSEELESVSAVTGVLGFAEFRRIAAEISALRTVGRLAAKEAAPGTGRVGVMGPRSLGYREFRWIFAPGIADGEFPARSSSNPLLQDGLVTEINATIWPLRILTSRDRQRREQLYLFMILDSASERVTLTFPRATLEGAPMSPSIYVAEITRHFARDPIDREKRDLIPRESGECLRHIADEWRQGLIDDGAARELLGSELVSRVRLEQRGAARGDVGRDVVRTDGAWHPSALDSLAACPFVFLARHRMGLRTQDLPDFEVPPMEIGKLAHEVLREFYATPVPAFEAEAIERMDSVIQRRLADADISGQGTLSVFDPSLWKIRRSQLVAALRQYVLFAVKDALEGYETVVRYLDERLPSASLGGILLGGKPDHVAVRRIGGAIEALRIDDFKYSAASSFTGKLLKDSLQIPIYAYLALKALDADETVHIDGRYLLLRSPSTPMVSLPIDGAVFQGIQARIGELVDKVKAGRLHPEPVDKQDCPTCDYRRLCRLHGN